ncbi:MULTISPECIES: iron-containing alcohol dehydrogenase [Shouchella]|uniref:NADH-dependent butanol dehydrogenase 1 n=3 Tax=Bacillaceae TaxID=186817 RepID=A0A060M4J9_9BACI|nr:MULTISPECIES: iron-containing alcohol dehydrogenase [Bacillaceae]RQW21201.1 iron-containing alcohol dehydrogenase [Bacillus sp. C1-1]AIC95468.1 NADH-dependent butanol dehydrogenase 1 [Shouchella lehensis G1]KQL55611.1 butanol dehydrogenase [Alkalicoccobacillus plakortidis]MBG9783811.1 butanol dehydrogenase [Shouchella lehensis]TES51228.1 iron-containing alcohol dehydrogenase [Shouchella lehensis]
MDAFTFYNPTKLIFGQGKTESLADELVVYDRNVLLVYGGGSIKNNGLYDKVRQQLEYAGCNVTELAGVEPNPRLTTVQKGIDLCKEHAIGFILAVGGGSVIDATKAIAVGARYDGDIWDIITKKELAEDALPFGTILTLAATGSEMNSGSVITNWETHQKIGWGCIFTFPNFSILDPENTVSVPKDQTVYGIVDMMTHVLEAYFHPAENTPLQDRICESILTTVIEAAPDLLDNLDDVDLRETILYSGTMALNGITQMGARGDWGSHNLEHAVSAVSDIPHAGGLAILFPHWMRHSVDVNPERGAQLAQRVFGVDRSGKEDRDVALEGINKLASFWTALGAPTTLSEYNITEDQLDEMADIASANGIFGNYHKIGRPEALEILKQAL